MKAALLSTVAEKINQSLMGEAYARRNFWYRIKPTVSDFDRRQLALREATLLLEEAVRIGGQ